MSKRTIFTTISPLPAGVSREVVIDFLHNHLEMIDLNPLVKERHPIKPPPHASPEEFHCIWYSLTDKISYLPGGLATGDVSYTCAFHDLPNGLQTHCYAPMGLDIRDKWTLGGSLPGEPVQPVELGIGAPITGLYIREDVDMRCNVFMTGFVKKNLKKSHAVLVDRLKVKAQIASAANLNHSMSIRHSINSATGGGRGGQQPGSPDPNQYPARPASTTTTASGHSSLPPPPHSPDPSSQNFAHPPNSPPPAFSSPPPGGYAHPAAPQGSVTWQSLKPSPSVASHYSPATHGRQPSYGNAPPHHPHQQQQQGYPQMNPYGSPQQQQYGPPGQYYQRYYQQSYQPNGPAELGGYYNHAGYPQQQQHPQEGQGRAPPLPAKDAQYANQPPRIPEDSKERRDQNSNSNGPFVAELEG